MKKENNSELKNKVMAGASVAGGAVAGAAAGMFFTAGEADAHEAQVVLNDEPAPDAILHEDSSVHSSSHSHSSHQAPVQEVSPEHPHSGEPLQDVPQNVEVQPVNPSDDIHSQQGAQAQQASTDEVEVLGYERVTGDDGQQMDVAVVSVGGEPMVLFDVDIDGYADAAAIDANGNGSIEEQEIIPVEHGAIAMQPLQAAVANPIAPADDPLSGHMAQNQNDLPDYMNEANVDGFMA